MRAQGLLYLCLCLSGGPLVSAHATRSLQLIDIRSKSAACGYVFADLAHIASQSFTTCDCSTLSTAGGSVDLPQGLCAALSPTIDFTVP